MMKRESIDYNIENSKENTKFIYLFIYSIIYFLIGKKTTTKFSECQFPGDKNLRDCLV